MLFAAKINSNEILKIRSSKKYSLTISNISLDLDSEHAQLFLRAQEQMVLVVKLDQIGLRAHHTSIRIDFVQSQRQLISLNGIIHVIGHFQLNGQGSFNQHVFTLERVLFYQQKLEPLTSKNWKEKNENNSRRKQSSNAQVGNHKSKSKSKSTTKVLSSKNLLDMVNNLQDNDDQDEDDSFSAQSSESSDSDDSSSESDPKETKRTARKQQIKKEQSKPQARQKSKKTEKKSNWAALLLKQQKEDEESDNDYQQESSQSSSSQIEQQQPQKKVKRERIIIQEGGKPNQTVNNNQPVEDKLLFTFQKPTTLPNFMDIKQS